MNITLPVGAALDAARACLARGDGVEAVAVLEDALQAAPDNAALLTGLGVALRFAGQIDAAASSFARALELAPDQADAQVYLGMIRLAQDRQQEGWRLYQARWRNVHWTEKLRYPEATRWDGRVSPSTAATGRPPMAAMSLRLRFSSFSPTARGGTVSSKCRP